jgi:chromosome segregation ATPase
MFESLSLLLKSVGDLDVESDVIVECLAKLSEDAGAAVGGAPRAADADGEQRMAGLAAELENVQRRQATLVAELENSRRRQAELEEELEELRSDDKAPEVFALKMKVKEQAEQIRRMTETEPLPRRAQRRPLGQL